MLKRILFILTASSIVFLNSCGRKTVPAKTASVTSVKSKNADATSTKENSKPKKTNNEPVAPKTDTAAVVATEEKAAPKPAAKPDFPKVISVNDDAASKSVDGRLFYDVLGHRYWKNYNDGKYYLFDKSMYNNPDFKPPK